MRSSLLLGAPKKITVYVDFAENDLISRETLTSADAPPNQQLTVTLKLNRWKWLTDENDIRRWKKKSNSVPFFHGFLLLSASQRLVLLLLLLLLQSLLYRRHDDQPTELSQKTTHIRSSHFLLMLMLLLEVEMVLKKRLPEKKRHWVVNVRLLLSTVYCRLVVKRH